MKRILGFLICVMMSSVFDTPLSISAMPPDGWGHSIGPVSGTVTGGDAPGGLTVRSTPGNGGRVIGHLAAGTSITAYNVFTNGWVQLRTPFDRGWVRMRYVEPRGAGGLVTSVDYPEGCLRVRSGPSTGYGKVGCLAHDRRIRLSGIWSTGNWAEVVDPVRGWVGGTQISSSINPLDEPVRVAAPVVESTTTVSRPYVVTEEIYPLVRTYPRYPRHGYSYRGGGVAVGVGPGSVRVRAPGVGVGVGPRGVGVRVGGVGVRVRP